MPISPTVLVSVRSVLRLSTLAGLAALTGCATTPRSPLPVETARQASTPLTAVRTVEHDGRLIVTGRAQPPSGVLPGHVEVQLLSPENRIIATRVDRLQSSHPRSSQARHGQASFIAGFPADEARHAARVIVSYHPGGHSHCATTVCKG